MEPTGFEQLELLDLDPKTRKVIEGSRILTPGQAVGLYVKFRDGDDTSSINRARLDGMFDGTPPYDQAVLKATGQGHRCNLNFGEAQRMLDMAMSGYVDLINSVRNLVSVQSTMGEPGMKLRQDAIISEEITNVLRGWRDFDSLYLRLVTFYIKHGVGIAYFENSHDWRWKVCGLSDFVIPRQTPASENAVEIAFSRASYTVHELYAKIRDPEKAESDGIHVGEVKRAILEEANRDGKAKGAALSNWEDVESRLKNGDLYMGLQSKAVSVIHTWVREMDGVSISHYMCLENKPREWIYKGFKRFKSSDQAFIFFTYGTGNNGTFHSIRGLGQRIYAHVQVSNRLRCQMVDAAAMASTVMLRPDNPRALQELSYSYWGPYSILSDRVDIVTKEAPDLTKSVVPAITDLSRQLQESVDFYSTSGAAQGSPYRTKMQVQAELESATRLASANLNLFYSAWHRVLRESSRRLINGSLSDPEVREFYRRLKERNISPEVVKSVDHRKTRAMEAIGAGNPSARAVALNDIADMMGSMAERGRRNALFDRAASRVGYEMAGRYFEEPEAPSYEMAFKIAELENNQLMRGDQIQVQSGELHESQLQVHIPRANQVVQQIETGEIDPMQSLSGLKSLLSHISQHADELAGDPLAETIVAAAREVLNNAGNVVENMERKIRAEQRRQAESGQPEGDEGAVDLKRQAAELDMQITREKADLEMSILEARAEQERRIRDAKAAGDLERTQRTEVAL